MEGRREDRIGYVHGTCHNDKPGQSRDKVLKMESRRVEVREELEGGSGGTCHNDKPGRNAGVWGK